jgi:hypothetical protein
MIKIPVEVIIKIESEILCGDIIDDMGVHALKLAGTPPYIL